ncbi:PREDICTED: WEB family protein At4g27595, chloroplastic-like [Tarenaya hassleriana]|uniref:WEB family protein At4g27595, chloroplastic-like n=1 Tax=Tarenaya hassleriana TaxID=28532 RepID=UPI0008FD4C3A|nr:PREDICTED: WEB family protein At4g27595, chloroplastic-like [Tarenaya hassleriana]
MKMLILLGLVLSSVYSCSNAQPQDPAACWKSIKTVEGCFESIISIFRGHFGNVKKECCETVNGFADNCWPIIFPSMPYIRFFIKGLCLLKYPQLESPRGCHRTGLLETPRSKPSPPTPPASKLSAAKSDGNSLSPVSSSRLSLDRSPQSVSSKPVSDRRNARVPTPPEKAQSRLGLAKLSDLQAQLNQVQEDLKKANEQIEFLKKEKAQALDGLKQSEKLAEEANEKIKKALAAQKRAEEDSEIEKFRVIELEQTGIEAVQKKKEALLKEVESIRNQHTVDISALLSTTVELQMVRQELTMTADAKNKALYHAEEATKIAEIQADKVEILSSELSRLKALLGSKQEKVAIEGNEVVSKLKSEIEMLRGELEKVGILEKTLKEQEGTSEQLHVDLEAAKMVESCANNLAAEWKNKADELEKQVEESNKLKRSTSESMEFVMKQLEENNQLLHKANSENDTLKEKVELLEMTIGQQKRDLEESERQVSIAKEESSKLEKLVSVTLSRLFRLPTVIKGRTSGTGLLETPRSKPSPPTPPASKLSAAKSDGNSLSPVSSSRLSLDRSPQSVSSKPVSDRRNARVPTPPEKAQSRLGLAKLSDLQAQLNQVQEDLKKANEQIEFLKKEKAQALDGLKQSEKLAEEANEKIKKALAAQKRAEEDSEIEKFRVIELEQTGIEAVQKKKEALLKEVESIRNQHTVDISALLSTTVELQMVRQELTMTADAKNKALYHAEEATKIAEIQADKVEILSSELSRLKALLGSKQEKVAIEGNEVVSKLKSEIEMLRGELEKVGILEKTLKEQEGTSEQLHVDLEAAKMVESCANNLAAEWKNKADELEKQVEESNKLKRSTSESMEFVMKQLEENNQLLHKANSENDTLKEKVDHKGSYIGVKGEAIYIPPYPCMPTDTCGAGDAYASGIMYGMLRGVSDIKGTGSLAARTAATVVGQQGTRLRVQGALDIARTYAFGLNSSGFRNDVRSDEILSL